MALTFLRWTFPGKRSLVPCAAFFFAIAQPTAEAESKGGDGSANTFDGILDSNYTRGKYESRQVSQLEAMTPTLDWTVFGHTTLSASVPFLIQRAPRGTIGGGIKGGAHQGNNRGLRQEEVTTSGLGDVLLGVDQDLLTQSGSVPIDVSVFTNVKIGTAEVSKGLGSGKNDYSFGGRIGHEWGKYSLIGEAGYTVVGDPGQVTANGVTSELHFQNVEFGSINGTYNLSDYLALGLGLNSTRSVERRLAAPTTVNANASYHVTERFIVKGSVLTGLNNDSPNVGVSLAAALAL